MKRKKGRNEREGRKKERNEREGRKKEMELKN